MLTVTSQLPTIPICTYCLITAISIVDKIYIVIPQDKSTVSFLSIGYYNNCRSQMEQPFFSLATLLTKAMNNSVNKLKYAQVSVWC